MKLGEALSAARKRAGVSQREVARRAGVPQSTVARIELGTVEPRAGTAEKILAATGHELVIQPRLGEGVDRSLIRRLLRMSPRARIEYGASAGDALRRLRQGVARGA